MLKTGVNLEDVIIPLSPFFSLSLSVIIVRVKERGGMVLSCFLVLKQCYVYLYIDLTRSFFSTCLSAPCVGFFSLTVNDMPPPLLRCGLPGRFVPPGTDGLATLYNNKMKRKTNFFLLHLVNDETKSGFFFFRQFDIEISNKLGFDFHYSWPWRYLI